MSIYVDRPKPTHDICVREQQLIRLGQIDRRLVHTVFGLRERLDLL